MRLLPLASLLIVCGLGPLGPALAAADGNPGETVIAESAFTYKVKDVETLVLIARRHLGRPFRDNEEQEVRDAIVALLLAREPLLQAQNDLPKAFSDAQRGRLLLDIVDYQADPAGKPTGAGNRTTPPTQTVPTTPQQPSQPAGRQSLELVALPPIKLRRPQEDGTSVELEVQCTLAVPPDQAKVLRQRLPLVIDGALSHFHQLAPSDFAALDLDSVRKGIDQALDKNGLKSDQQAPDVLITGFKVDK